MLTSPALSILINLSPNRCPGGLWLHESICQLHQWETTACFLVSINEWHLNLTTTVWTEYLLSTCWGKKKINYVFSINKDKPILEQPIVRESNQSHKGMRRTNWLLGLIFEGSAHSLSWSGRSLTESHRYQRLMKSTFKPSSHENETFVLYAIKGQGLGFRIQPLQYHSYKPQGR